MEFAFSWWFIATIIGYFVCVCIACTVYEGMPRSSTPVKVVFVFVGFFIPAVIGNLIYWGASLNSHELNVTPVSNQVVAEKLFGFKTDTEYPLVMGEQVTNFRGTASAVNGFFSSAATAETNGGPAITVSFTQGNTTYTLSLPRASTPIIVDDTKAPSMLIRFRPGLWNYGKGRADELATTGAHYPHIWSDCNVAIVNVAVACQRIETVDYSNLVVGDGYRQAGLGKLVEESFASAALTMTSSMYDRLVGKIS